MVRKEVLGISGRMNDLYKPSKKTDSLFKLDIRLFSKKRKVKT